MLRRVVAGQRNGKSVVISDNEPPRTHEYKHIPGMSWSLIWSTPRDVNIEQTLTDTEPVTQETTVFPAPGETRFLTLTIAPNAWAERADFNPEAAGAEIAEQMPDMFESFTKYGSPFHRSDSIDYAIVLDGEATLLLENDVQVPLRQHDVVVQVGTVHGWINTGERPATIAFVLTGAERKDH
jgi:hypothetical protein